MIQTGSCPQVGGEHDKHRACGHKDLAASSIEWTQASRIAVWEFGQEKFRAAKRCDFNK